MKETPGANMDDARGLYGHISCISHARTLQQRHINYLTSVMQLSRNKIVHFSFSGKFLRPVSDIPVRQWSE